MAETYVWDTLGDLLKLWRLRLHPGSKKLKRLERLLALSIEGTVLTRDDHDFIHDMTPNKPIARCDHLAPMGNCKKGVMEYCTFRKNWETGDRGCRHYVEELIRRE